MRLYFFRSYMIFYALFFFASHMSGQVRDSLFYSTKAKTYIEQADSLKDKNQLNQATLLLSRAQNIFEQIEDWENYVKCILRAATFLDPNINVKDRSRLLNKAIAKARQYLPIGHKYLIEALRSKGENLIDLGQLDSAQIILNEAIQTGKESKEWEETTWAIIVNAVLYYYNEDFTNMEAAIDSALSIAETNITNPSAHFDMITQLQAILFDATGDYEKAFLASQRTLKREIAKPLIQRSDSVNLANIYNTHGAIYSDRGDYGQAIYHYKIALDLHRKLYSSADYLIGLSNNISLSYKQKTDLEQALFYLNISKSLLPETPNQDNYQNWIRTYQLFSSNLIKAEKIDSAINLLEKLLPIGYQFNYDKNWLHSSMGKAMMKNNKPIKARLHYNLALLEMKALHGSKHPEVAKVYWNIGSTYSDSTDLLINLQYYQKALIAISSNFNDSLQFSNPSLESIDALTTFFPILVSKAHALNSLSKVDNKWELLALATYRLAISTIDKIRENHESEQAKLLLSTKAKEVYEGGIQMLYKLYHKNKDKALLSEAFQYAEKSKSLLLLEMIRSSEAREDVVNPLYSGDAVFYQLLERGKSIKTDLLFFEQKLKIAQKEKLPADHIKIKNAENALARLYREDLEWKTKINKSYPAYYKLQYNNYFADIHMLRNSLVKDNTAFIEYFTGEQSTFIFVITDRGEQFLKISNHTHLELVIKKLQAALLDYAAQNVDAQLAYKNYNLAAYQLYQIILEEALNTSTLSNISKLIIVPDGHLNNVPFEALNTSIETSTGIDFGKLPYLMNNYQVHYGYSANLLLANRDRYTQVKSNTKCLALAPPYISQANTKLSRKNNQRNGSAPLDGAIYEIQEIANTFSGRFDYSPSATEAFFKQEAPKFGILHLAMHAVVDYENPNFAHLKFTNLSKDTLEDNLLHHFEIVNMKFDAQLATLSACETGLGKYQEGEGVFSLARSFMYAGVPSVVMSLWKIDDQSTSQLIPLFYKNLATGLDKDGALQKAKKDFLREVDLEFRHPYYWSGVVLLGEDQKLKGVANTSWWWIGIFLLLLPVFYFFRKKLVPPS